METVARVNEEKNEKQSEDQTVDHSETTNPDPVDPPALDQNENHVTDSPEKADSSDKVEETAKPPVDGLTDIEIENMTVDPLEVARRAANEDEREITCASEKASGGEPEGPKSQPLTDLVNDSSPEPETVGSNPDHKRETATSQASEVGQESERDVLGFDLNHEVCSEETDKNSNQRLDIDLNVADENENGEESVKLQLDLNLTDQPFFQNSSNLFNGSRVAKNRGENVISLFGAKVWEAVPEPGIEGCWGLGSLVNGFRAGPGMYFASAYGPPGAPNPYMAQVPVAPQFAFTQQAPAFMAGEGPSENNGGLREFLNENRDGSSSSRAGEKRKEPEGGREGFPVSYKHHQLPWK